MGSNRQFAATFCWLWVPVLGIGLGLVLAGPAPPGISAELARSTAQRMLHGDFAVGWAYLATVAAAALWLIGKQLAVIAAFVWLEWRFVADHDRRDYLVAWIARALSITLVISLTVVLLLLDVLPSPLLDVGQAPGVSTLLLILVPAFLLNLLVLDFFHYWAHRAFHHYPALWRLHALHHSLDTSALNNFSHPIEDLLATLWVGIPSALLIGVSDEQLFLLVAFTSIHSHINHTRLPIHLGPLGKWLLSDNRFHFIHHSADPAHHNKNFAERFPVLDRMFGTYFPGETMPSAVGLADRRPPQTLGEYLTVNLQPRVPIES